MQGSRESARVGMFTITYKTLSLRGRYSKIAELEKQVRHLTSVVSNSTRQGINPTLSRLDPLPSFDANSDPGNSHNEHNDRATTLRTGELQQPHFAPVHMITTRSDSALPNPINGDVDMSLPDHAPAWVPATMSRTFETVKLSSSQIDHLFQV